VFEKQSEVKTRTLKTAGMRHPVKDLRHPASAEFHVHAAITNGRISSDFPITVQGSFGLKTFSGTVGGGGGRELKVATTNGGIELKKN
jgi:hypothetical protein